MSSANLAWSVLLLAALGVMSGCGSNDQPSTSGGATPTTSTAAPAKADQTSTKPVIGVSLLTLANPFFKEMGDAMVEEGQKKGYDVIITSGDLDPAKQKDQVKDFLVRKVAAIVLTPCDSRSIGTPIADANKQGVPVFTADVACTDRDAVVVSHIATDNYGGGKDAADAVIEAIGGKGKVAIIDHPEVESGMQRTKGFEEELAAKGADIKIVAKLPGHGKREDSFKVAQDILQSNPDVDAIFAINDPSALGVVAAIEAAGKTGKIKVVGFDGQPEAKQAIKDGKIYADAVQYPKKIGAMTIDSIADYLAGEKPKPQQLIPTGLYRQADAKKDPDLK
jgi:ribose transport system substrate-binding protein